VSSSRAATVRIGRELAARLYDRARASQWGVSESSFEACLERSAAKALAGEVPDASRLERYLSSLHLEDLALACACADGHDAAWDHFVMAYRPTLYRAADAIDPGGGARELADSIYADLFGLQEHQGERRSLFRYYHGRSSLATWLRAVLAQRQVDRVRAGRRLAPLEDEETMTAAVVRPAPSDPDARRFLVLIKQALLVSLANLSDRDRLRLGCYYREDLTLAQTGKLLGEHEATVSRQLARTRKALRAEVERYLTEQHGLSESQISECFASTIEDPGSIDLGKMLRSAEVRKDSEPERST
jgi:RNA polymerase sigma-70 factor (ECF subfamily)